MPTEIDPAKLWEPVRDDNGIPLPKSEQPRKLFKTEKLNFGETLLRSVDPKLEVLSLEQHKAICEITNGEAVTALLHFPVDEAMCPDLREVSKVFGCLAAEGLKIPHIILSLRLYCAAQNALCITDATEILKTPKIKKRERIETLRLKHQAVTELTKNVNSIQKLAEKLAYIQQIEMPEDFEEEPEPPKPLKIGVAPDLE